VSWGDARSSLDVPREAWPSCQAPQCTHTGILQFALFPLKSAGAGAYLARPSAANPSLVTDVIIPCTPINIIKSYVFAWRGDPNNSRKLGKEQPRPGTAPVTGGDSRGSGVVPAGVTTPRAPGRCDPEPRSAPLHRSLRSPPAHPSVLPLPPTHEASEDGRGLLRVNCRDATDLVPCSLPLIMLSRLSRVCVIFSKVTSSASSSSSP